MTRNHIGVDLSQAALDIFDPLRGAQRMVDRPAAIARWVAGLGPADVVVCDATSGCDRDLRAALEAEGRDVVRLNAWPFARSPNLARTDRVDARMLAGLGAERQPEPDPASDPAREALRAFSQRRDQPKRMQAQEKNRLGAATHRLVAQDIGAEVAGLARRLARIDAAIAGHIASHPALAVDAAQLRTIPGIGAVTATEILAHLPEAGHVDRRAAASLAELAPRAHGSGKFKARRSLGDGRRHLRRALCMAALSSLCHAGFLSGFVARLKADRRPAKVILMAVVRRLLVIANTILRTREPFRQPMIP